MLTYYNSTQESILRPGFTIAGFIPFIFNGFQETQLPGLTTDEAWMLEAFTTSLGAAGHTSPNPTVGCVLLSESDVELGRGATSAYGGKHAEINALASVANQELLKAGTAYVTLEPCSHTGQTGPCVSELLKSGIKRCVIAMEDPNPLVAGNGIKALREAGIQVDVGVLGAPIAQWHAPFVHHVTRKTPYIAIKWAQTLDGCLCDDDYHSRWISGEEAQRYTHWLRQRYDAVMVGAGTLIKDRPHLNVRNISSDVARRDPIRIVFDPLGELAQLDATARAQVIDDCLMQNPDSKILYASPDQTPDGLHAAHIKCLALTSRNFSSALNELSVLIGSKDITTFLGKPLQSILVETGPHLLSLFLKERVFDAAHCYINPSFLGGKRLNISSLLGTSALTELHRFRLVTTQRLGNDTLIEFQT